MLGALTRLLILLGALLLTGGSQALAAGASPSFTFSTDATSPSAQCALDGATPASCSSPQAYSSLAPGAHKVTITFSFTVPVPGPSGHTTAATNITDTTATLNAVASCPPGSDCPVHFLFDRQDTGYGKVPAGASNTTLVAGVNQMPAGTKHTYRLCFGYDDTNCVGPDGTSSTSQTFTTTGGAAPPPPPPPAEATLGVKSYWDNGYTLPSASQLSAVGAGTHSIFMANYSPCPAKDPTAIPEVTISTIYGAAALDYTHMAACVAQVTGGNGWYSVGNEPEDSYSDNVDPATAATRIHSWITAIRAVDPAAHFVGPNLTSWTSVPNSNAYPWGPPATWFNSMVSSYQSQFGSKPPFDRLSVHGYVNPDMSTAFMDQPAPVVQMLDQFSAAAAANGYSSKVWMTEGGVVFAQDLSVTLTSSQQQTVTSYAHSVRTDPNVERVLYFQGGGGPYPAGWNTGGGSSVRAPFDSAWQPTEVGRALAGS